jgi:Putative Flagellin, Flp1-like, domain
MKKWFWKKWIQMNHQLKTQRGMGTLELLMILAVLVSVALIFRQWIFTWFGDLVKDVKPIQSATTHVLPTPST